LKIAPQYSRAKFFIGVSEIVPLSLLVKGTTNLKVIAHFAGMPLTIT
tara:strand:+ start:93 stop:233 length:141 start_codon:yes stop_codon:yes gene_type:complete